MKTPPDTRRISAQDWARLHDVSRRRAQAFRREAVDDFWRGADAAFQATLSSVGRSAQRLAHRLAQHGRGRAAQANAPVTHSEGI